MKVQCKKSAIPSSAQKRAYGVAASRACEELGIRGAEACRSYRRRVVAELTGCESFAEVRTNADVDAVMRRLWADAGDYAQASRYGVNRERQMAYVVKVMAVQLMQLKGGDEAAARDYIGGVLDQAHVANGHYTGEDGYWMDVRPDQVAALLKMLDTERRRILRRFGARAGAGAFSDRVRYELDGAVLVRQGVEAGYYARVPFRVTMRAA